MADIPIFSSDGTRSTKYERILTVRSEALPDSFRQNSLKENLVLEYVDNFRKQFVQLYPDRPPLLLAPLNEAGVPKFVSTTIRPTQLPFRELYDVSACAAFFAAYLHFEPMDNPTEIPPYLPSPFFTLQTRVGDAFDLATVLVSYLIGSGYDAYVVSGRAPKWVTLRMEDRSSCEWKPPADAVNTELHSSPLALALEEPQAVGSEFVGASRYRLPALPSLDSQYAQLLAKKATAAQTGTDAIPGERVIEIKQHSNNAAFVGTRAEPKGSTLDSADTLAPDPLYGRRVHAWVLVRAGKRELSSHIFVEPSTGAIYPVGSSPYLAVESLWNHCNYFANMQNQPLIPQQLRQSYGGTEHAPATTEAVAEHTVEDKANAVAAATVAGLLASSVAPELLSPYSSLVGAALGTGGGTVGTTMIRGKSGALAGSQKDLSSRARSRSRGRTAIAWRDDLEAQRRGLQAGVVSAIASQNFKPVSGLAFDLNVEQDWEFVMMPHVVDGRRNGDGRAGGGKEDTAADSFEDVGSLEAAVGGFRSLPSASASSGSAGLVGIGSSGILGNNRDELSFELDGEHVLDLPQSWCPRLTLDRYVAKVALGGSDSRTVNYFRSRMETFIPHTHPTGLITRLSTYKDTGKTILDCVTEVFSRRKDGLYKRVRSIPLCIVEEHYEKGRAFGLALVIEVMGLRRELYFYPGSRIDGLLKRVHVAGVKITEYYGSTANRLWYRSISLVPGSDTFVEATAVPTVDVDASRTKVNVEARNAVVASGGSMPVRSVLTVDVGQGREASIRKMTEKYRRDPSVPVHLDVAKAVYLLDEKMIHVTLQHAPGRITVTSRVYQKPTGQMEPMTVDPYAPEPRPYDLDAEYRRLALMEKDCHNAARLMAKLIIELLASRSSNERHVELERSLFEIASDRARTGAPLDEETDKHPDESDKEMDYLLPFLLSSKAADPANPSEKESRKADRDCRAAFKERLLERVAIIQRRLDDENEKLLRKQQAFSRTRDHAEGAEEDFERYCAEATFRIGILEQRLERQEALVTRKYQELEHRLQGDPRLAPIYAATLQGRNGRGEVSTGGSTQTPSRSLMQGGARS